MSFQTLCSEYLVSVSFEGVRSMGQLKDSLTVKGAGIQVKDSLWTIVEEERRGWVGYLILRPIQLRAVMEAGRYILGQRVPCKII